MSSEEVSCDGRYVVYLLREAGSGRTYIGQTVNFSKRLRQHNGEISGGARYTTRHGSDWRPIAIVDGFGADGKVEALRFEWKAKRDTQGRVISGARARLENIKRLMAESELDLTLF